MMIREKMIFWPLAAVFTGILILGFTSQGNKKSAVEELMRDIELATKKSKARIKEDMNKLDFAKIKGIDDIGDYKLLLKRSPFFRVRPEEKAKKTEPIPVKEPPKKAILKYKGKVVMGSKVMVIIEDQGTGKSSFAQEGDMIGDFLVSGIDEARVVLKKKDGEEVILNVVKKEDGQKRGKEEDLEVK
jgi:hypothetical protein